jgi:predicted transcriptional regulator
MIKSEKKYVFISVLPEYAEKIFSKVKSVELRRRFPAVPEGSKLLIYSSSPEQKVLGSASIKSIYNGDTEKIWKKYNKQACVEEAFFDKYFSGVSEGYALELTSIKKFSKPVTLAKLKSKYKLIPPQSFKYLEKETYDKMVNE